MSMSCYSADRSGFLPRWVSLFSPGQTVVNIRIDSRQTDLHGESLHAASSVKKHHRGMWQLGHSCLLRACDSSWVE